MYFQNICSDVEYFTVFGIVIGTLGDISHLKRSFVLWTSEYFGVHINRNHTLLVPFRFCPTDKLF